MQRAWTLLKQTLTEWSQDNVARLAAALAYYTAFAIAPTLVIAIAIAGLFLGREAASDQVAQQVSMVMGPRAGEAVNEMVEAAGERKYAGVVATIIGIATLLFGATGVFGELQNAMAVIWDVEQKAGQGIWSVVKQRFLSFTMVLGVGFLLLVSLVVSAALAAVTRSVGGAEFWETMIGHAINLLIWLGVTTLLFAAIFKYLPDVKVRWRDVWLGAAATAVLFTLGKTILGWYLGRESTTSAYGAAGSFVALLLWIYYSAHILFLGAEFTQVYTNASGAAAPAEEHAGAHTAQKQKAASP